MPSQKHKTQPTYRKNFQVNIMIMNFMNSKQRKLRTLHTFIGFLKLKIEQKIKKKLTILARNIRFTDLKKNIALTLKASLKNQFSAELQ